MNKEQQQEFYKLSEDYTNALHMMNNFITVNKLDYDEVWDLANQHYDEDCTHEPKE